MDARVLQARLDECWAFVGDVYGDGHFGLKLRTVSTPLADPARARLDRSLPYVPQLARLTTASAELIRLLTGPLYGDRPEVGIRELLQNALDAVRERAHWPPAADGVADPRLQAWQCDVMIRLLPATANEVNCWLEVVDRGVGMTPDTVREYFLRVGALLRHDDDWLQRFPPATQAKLLRSGHFGIGTLAAYLLGDRVQVTTRHVTETDGIGTCFVARLSDAPVELRRLSAPVGTSIRIPIPKAVDDTLASRPDRWDWFALQAPASGALSVTLRPNPEYANPRTTSLACRGGACPSRDLSALCGGRGGRPRTNDYGSTVFSAKARMKRSIAGATRPKVPGFWRRLT
jgi:molecular chaperone HtpG